MVVLKRSSMVELQDAPAPRGLTSLRASLALDSPAEATFALLCSVQKWPVWLSFLRSAKPVVAGAALGLGSEVVLCEGRVDAKEHLYEIDRFIANYHLSLVGAYSMRRRLDFRIENRLSRSKLHVNLTYPTYGGRLGTLLGGWKYARSVATALERGLIHFKGLAEFRNEERLLADF